MLREIIRVLYFQNPVKRTGKPFYDTSVKILFDYYRLPDKQTLDDRCVLNFTSNNHGATRVRYTLAIMSPTRILDLFCVTAGHSLLSVTYRNIRVNSARARRNPLQFRTITRYLDHWEFVSYEAQK